jgi:hypothetical protein
LGNHRFFTRGQKFWESAADALFSPLSQRPTACADITAATAGADWFVAEPQLMPSRPLDPNVDPELALFPTRRWYKGNY